MSLLEQTTFRDGIAMAGIIQFPEKTVEIYGEIHGNENKFCNELIQKDLLLDYEVLCEHSTLFCTVKKNQHGLFKDAKGSEYIFYKLATGKGRKPICFDTRLENGLPSAFDEMAFLDFFTQMETMKMTAKSLTELSTITSKFIEIIGILSTAEAAFRTLYKSEYDHLMRSIDIQLKILIKSMKRGVRFINGTGFFLDHVSNKIILCKVGYALAINVRKLCSAFVDLNIFLLIAKSTHSKIVVFTGASHAYRLLTMALKKKSQILIEAPRKLCKDLEFSPKGDCMLELAFLDKLNL